MDVRKFIAVGSIGTAAACVVALWMLGSALSAPAPRSIGDPPDFLRASAVSFASESGSTIQAWLVQGVAGRGGVVLAHSVRSNRIEMVERARFLNRAGYTLLLFDSQAHGESPGDHITFGYLESLDARGAVAFLQGQFPAEPVGYLGVSQGGAAGLIGTPLPVQALILEAVYPTLRDAVVNRIRIRLGPLAPFVAPLLLVQVEPRLGIDPDLVTPIEGIQHIRAPLLLIAGERDQHTRLSESERLFAAAPEPKSLWVVPEAAHVDFHRFDRSEYERRILAFLSRTLRPATAPIATDTQPLAPIDP